MAATTTEQSACSRRRRAGVRGTASTAVALVLAASGCASQHSAGSRTAAARYLAIANSGNQHLDTDFDRLEGPDHAQLGAAQADLRDAAATERLFDQRLLAIPFPAQTEAVARELFAVNEQRAALTTAAAGSASLAELASYEKQLTAANVPVEKAVTTIRAQLGLPPPPTS